MKLKAFFSIVLAFITLISISGCSSAKNEERSAFFMLENDPSLSFKKEKVEIVDRFYENLTTKFVTSSEYGEIMPFIGKYQTYSTKPTKKGETKTVTNALYGICTESGKIIVDPIYKSVEQHKLNDGTCFYIFRIDSKSTTRADTYIAIGHDGTWMIEFNGNTAYSGIGGDGRIAFIRTKKKNGEIIKTYYDFYDYSGKKCFTYEPLQNFSSEAKSEVSFFCNSLAAVNETYVDSEGNETHSAYYIDKSGRKKYADFTYAGNFFGGFAIVSDKSGLYGVLKSDGKYLINPKFKSITYNKELGYFSCEGDEIYYIFNTNGESVKQINTKSSDVTIVGSKIPMYKKTSRASGKSEFFYLDNDQPFIFSGTGQFPTEYISGGIYVCDYSNVCYFFDEMGEEIFACENFGSIVSSDGNYIVVENKRGDKLFFIDFNAKKMLYGIEYSYKSGVADKGIFIVETGNGSLSLYNATNNTFPVTDCSYIEIINSFNNEFFCTLRNGFIELYDLNFNVILRTKCGGGEQ